MAFEKQKRDYSCGAASLRYALTFLGRSASERELRRASHTNRVRGTDEEGIAAAARRHQCDTVMRTYRRFSPAYQSLTRYVQGGQPCILCVDGWKHWVAVAAANRRGIALFDPRARDVARVIKPVTLRRRWAHRPDEDEEPYFFFMAIRPRVGRRSLRTSGKIDHDLVQRLKRHEDLRQEWDRYLLDLIDIFGRQPSRAEDSYPAWRFLSRNEASLVELVSYWDGNLTKSFYRTELRNLKQVCRAYGFTIRPRDERKALVSLTCILNHGAHNKY